jgi:hypothetical protein
MTDAVRPFRGGYTKLFGAAIFIKAFLDGRGPEFGVTRIDPERGAPQADLHSAYKLALHMALADDQALRDIDEAIKAGRPYPDEEFEIRRSYYLSRIPSRLCRMRYASFTNYFARLIKLGWVEGTGEEEPSRPQESWPDARPRVYYRLTPAGRAAPEGEWSNPLRLLYPQFDAAYFEAKRKGRRYFRRR